jgi:hypothetical protein
MKACPRCQTKNRDSNNFARSLDFNFQKSLKGDRLFFLEKVACPFFVLAEDGRQELKKVLTRYGAGADKGGVRCALDASFVEAPAVGITGKK